MTQRCEQHGPRWGLLLLVWRKRQGGPGRIGGTSERTTLASAGIERQGIGNDGNARYTRRRLHRSLSLDRRQQLRGHV